MGLAGKRILVTGGAGFIGSHLVEDLLRAGARVRVFDNLASGRLDNLEAVAADVEVVRGDVRDRDAVAAAARNVDAVSHQAAKLEITHAINEPFTDLETNTGGTLNVLRAARHVERVVVASSACVYGQAREIPQREDTHPTNPNWEYGVSKLAAEKYCRIFTEATGVPTINLRYAIVYGEREWYGRALTIFLRRLHHGQPPVVFGAGDQLRDFVHVSDVVRLHRACFEDGPGGAEVLNVSTGVGASIADLARLAVRVSGKALGPIFEDVAEGERSGIVEEQRMRLPAELKAMVLSHEKAARLLGWAPRVSLEAGLAQEWSWLQDHADRWTRMAY